MTIITTTDFAITDLNDKGAKEATDFAQAALFGNDTSIIETQAIFVSRYDDGSCKTTVMDYQRDSEVQLNVRSQTITIEEHAVFRDSLIEAFSTSTETLKDVN